MLRASPVEGFCRIEEWKKETKSGNDLGWVDREASYLKAILTKLEGKSNWDKDGSFIQKQGINSSLIDGFQYVSFISVPLVRSPFENTNTSAHTYTAHFPPAPTAIVWVPMMKKKM